MRADELMQRMFDPISRWILILYLVKLFLRQSVVVFPHQDGQVCVVQEAYPPNNTTVSIERRSPDRVLKRGAEDPELFVSSR